MLEKKVLHVVSIAFSLKYFVGNQFIYFSDRGVDYTVACSDSEDLHTYAREKRFRVFPVPILRKISPLKDLRSIFVLASFMRREKFDIVVAHTPKGGLIGILAAALARVPTRVYFRHGLVFETSSGIKKKLLIIVEKLVSYFAHRIINVSNSVRKESEAFKLNNKSKNLLLGEGSCNGIDLRLYTPKNDVNYSDSITIGFVGRLSRDKGITELVRGWSLIQEKYPKVRLLLVGPFDTRDTIPFETRLIINSSSSIAYLGEVENASEYYAQMDVFILPSYREGFPTVILEASASGLPVITTRKTGCIDAIKEGITGIYTELNPESIAQAIEYYLTQPEKRIEHGKLGRQWMEESFDEEIIYQEIKKKILL
ncbi:glycosyltransferase family 4 protein [Sphingobacterium spiritivorum]|uniref:glycosyltransferase family 4 protein n=1 Tax=Sphingobacterium spiritivorum TaxID=258 RepID=UPI003DA4B717